MYGKLRQIFDDFYHARVIGQAKLGSSTVEENSVMMWVILQSHEVMAKFTKHKIKLHPSITSIFILFFIKKMISDPLKETTHMKKDIKGLITKSYCHHSRLMKPE